MVREIVFCEIAVHGTIVPVDDRMDFRDLILYLDDLHIFPRFCLGAAQRGRMLELEMRKGSKVAWLPPIEWLSQARPSNASIVEDDERAFRYEPHPVRHLAVLDPGGLHHQKARILPALGRELGDRCLGQVIVEELHAHCVRLRQEPNGAGTGAARGQVSWRVASRPSKPSKRWETFPCERLPAHLLA